MDVDWLRVVMGLFGGLALFLGGLDRLSEGLQQAAGPSLRTVLARLTTNRFAGALTGAGITALLNSSTITTMLVVGFVTAGVMTLQQSVGVIMGANIGSTITAQMLAFDIAAYALAPIAIGFFMTFVGKREGVRQSGMMLLGFGLVFFGMGIMSDAMVPLRSYPPFIDLLTAVQRPLLGVLVGALFTALIQSSAATLGIAIALASEGLLSLQGGLALALGANIGTCGTALLAAIGKPTAAMRASVVHLAFNVIGTLLWLPMLTVLAGLAVRVSPAAPELDGIARAAAEVPRQLANANTLFNVFNTMLFIPFTAAFARLATWLVRERDERTGPLIEPRFLDDTALAVPSLALLNARREVGRVGSIAQEILAAFPAALRERDPAQLAAIAQRFEELTALEAAILRYLGLLRQGALGMRESAEVQQLMEATFLFESVGRLGARDLADVAQQAGALRSSAETAEMLRGLYETTIAAVAGAARSVAEGDAGAAAEVVALDARVAGQVHGLLERQATRLRSDDPDYLVLARLQMSIVDKLGRAQELASRIARGVLALAAAARGEAMPPRRAAI